MIPCLFFSQSAGGKIAVRTNNNIPFNRIEFQRILIFYLFECPVRTFHRVKKSKEIDIDVSNQPHPKYNYHFIRVSCRGKSFEDKGITGPALNSFRAAMKRVADTDILLKAVSDLSEIKSYESNAEYLLIRKNDNNVSYTEGFFYCIRNAFAHGSFKITESRDYYFENWNNGNLNGTARIKEKTLLSWIELFYLDLEEIKKAGK